MVEGDLPKALAMSWLVYPEAAIALSLLICAFDNVDVVLGIALSLKALESAYFKI